MKCPVDGAGLKMTERQGIEIDDCPTCRGVWLDRGELDKIIGRAAPEAAPPVRQRRHDHDDDRYRHGYDERYRGDYKKKSILSELFDFQPVLSARRARQGEAASLPDQGCSSL